MAAVRRTASRPDSGTREAIAGIYEFFQSFANETFCRGHIIQDVRTGLNAQSVYVQCIIMSFFAATTYPPSNCKSRLLSPSSLTIIQFFVAWL